MFFSYLIKFIFRLKISVRDYVDDNKNIFLLGNHTSYLDLLVLQIVCNNNVVFFLDKNIYKNFLFRYSLCFFNIVTTYDKSDEEISNIIKQTFAKNKSIVIFPERNISRNGHINKFSANFEKLTKHLPEAFIVPFYIDGLWANRLSFATKKTRDIRSNILVSFGEQISYDSKASVVRDKIIDLSLVSMDKNINTNISKLWFKNIKKHKKFFIADSTGAHLNNTKILVAVMLVGKFLQNRLTNKQNVATILPSVVSASVVNMALLNLGKTVCHLNYIAGNASLHSALELAKADTIITSTQFLEKLNEKGYDFSALFSNVNVVYLEEIKEYSNIVKKIKYLFYTFLPSNILYKTFAKNSKPDSTAFILFSSGSENTPKGIKLTHKNIIGNVIQVRNMLDLDYDDVFMATLPIFHSFGLTICIIMPQLTGIKTVYHPDPTDGLQIAELIDKYKCSVMCSTPTFLRLYTTNNKIKPESFQTLKKFVVGAEKLTNKIRTDFINKFGVELYEGYGATETSPVISCNIFDKLVSDNLDSQIGKKIGTVGRAIIGTKVLIVDHETYQELETSQEGMIIIGGVQVMKGYVDNEAQTKKVIKNINGIDFYITGDKGRIDEDGFITIIDRYSRFAKIAGEMVSLSSLELEITKYIKDMEICITNLLDSKKGERIVLLHTDTIDIKKLKKILASNINPLFIPRDFIKVDEIPKLGSGKTNFFVVKELAIKMTNKN